MKNRVFRPLVLGLLTLGLLSLSACNEDPQPSPHDARNIEQTRLAVTKMGEPFVVNDCQVQAHRVTVSGSLPNFTMVTAQCPTAMTSATHQSCGKNCVSEAVRVEPRADTKDEDTAQRVEELRKQLDAMQKELRQLESRAKR